MTTENTDFERVLTNATVRMVSCDWDNRCKLSLATREGFRITEKGKTDTQHKPGYYSIHSPLYGTDYSDDHAFEDRCRCECGKTVGISYRGKICQYCGHEVEYVGIDMSKKGWIVLEKDYLIQTEFYKKIQSIIGVKNFQNILKYKDPRERDANIKYDGIGMVDFREMFDEVMAYYVKKKPTKYNQYLFIMSHRDQVFIQCIPVYSSQLRPFVIKAEEIKYSDDDKAYKRLFSNSVLLNDRFELARRQELAENNYDKGDGDEKLQRRRKKKIEDLRKEGILYSMQMDLELLWDLNFDIIKKKTGTIRGQILGGRLNYSARNVIIPNKHLRANEIELGYVTFLELYKLEIISVLESIYGIRQAEAWGMWQRAVVNFDPKVYKVMQYIVDRGDAIVEINRNPTINYGSQLVVKIVRVKPDIHDFTMSLPESILRVFNADFDGDVLNIICIKISSMAREYYKKLNPMRNIFISRNDGLYNTEASIFKDQAIEFYTFLNI